jgi:hypothetical protein
MSMILDCLMNVLIPIKIFAGDWLPKIYFQKEAIDICTY